MHAQLSDIFRYWQQRHFVDRLRDVTGAKNHVDLYATAIQQGLERTGRANVISLGAGNGQLEIDVAKLLKARGVDGFHIVGTDLSPAQAERAESRIAEAGMADCIDMTVADLNREFPGETVAAVMAHHTLHHIVELEWLFDRIHASIAGGGVFVSFDVIGRNGHMRWPEALAMIEPLWRTLPPQKRYHHQLKRIDEEFLNWDSSTKGYEGIRAQDILALLCERFDFESFLGFGNLIDVFTSRGYGPNFDARNEHDRAFIDFVQVLNDTLIDVGYLKPTRMCAVMSAEQVPHPRFHRHWNAAYSVRTGPPTALTPAQHVEREP